MESDYLSLIRYHQGWMSEALKLAQIAGDAGEVPVGCIIVNSQGDLIGEGENRKQRDQDPTAHAEIIAIRSAARTLQNWHLDKCTLYVTLEPCSMCAGAIIHARLQTLVYAVDDPKKLVPFVLLLTYLVVLHPITGYELLEVFWNPLPVNNYSLGL